MVPANNNYNANNYNYRRNANWIPSLFNELFGNDFNWLNPTTRKSTPAINVLESDKDYKVELAVPGVQKEDSNVKINDDTLTIAVEKHSSAEEADKRKFLRQEFSYAKFEQRFTLPEDVDKKAIKAEVRDGILNITLPKQEPKAEEEMWQNIEIQ